MPTLPVHQGCCGEPVDDVDAVGELLRVVLVAGHALAVAVAADVDPYGGVAVARVPGVALGVARALSSRSCGTGGTRAARGRGRSASAGRQMRACSWTFPSRVGIQTSSRTTWRSNCSRYFTNLLRRGGCRRGASGGRGGRGRGRP